MTSVCTEPGARALDVLGRLADPATVATVAGHERNVLPMTEASTWNPVSLAHGHPGVALAAGIAAAEDGDWLRVAHAHIAAAVDAMPRMISTGLFCGPASVLAATVAARRAGASYAKLYHRLAIWVADDLLDRVTREAQRRAVGPGVPWHAYDVVSGVAGLTRLLMCCVDDPGGDTEPVVRERIDRAVQAGIEQLVAVLAPVRVAGAEVPGWWVPSHLQPVAEDAAAYPEGDFNAGLAHGVAGPLALLSTAAERGHARGGAVQEATARAGDWLVARALRDEAGWYWPCRVPFRQERSGIAEGPVVSRSAWCYGAAGVAPALFAAGRAWRRPDWRDIAEAGLDAVFERPRDRWNLDGVTVCHGLAGLLGAVRLVRGRAGPAAELAAELTGGFDPDAPFGYRHEVLASPRGARDGRFISLDVAGVLEGASGVACVLFGQSAGATLFDELVFCG